MQQKCTYLKIQELKYMHSTNSAKKNNLNTRNHNNPYKDVSIDGKMVIKLKGG